MSPRREIVYAVAQIIAISALFVLILSGEWQGATIAALASAMLLSSEARQWRAAAIKRRAVARLLRRLQDAIDSGNVNMEEFVVALRAGIEEVRRDG